MSRPVHFEIHAAHPEQAVAFYEALLGWQFSRWGEEPYWVITTGPDGTPGINGGLVERRTPPPADGQPVNGFVCTVDVEQVDVAVDKALSMGGSLALAKAAVPGVGWVAYVKDPDGNILGMMQYDASAT